MKGARLVYCFDGAIFPKRDDSYPYSFEGTQIRRPKVSPALFPSSQVHHRVSHYSLRFPLSLTRAQQVHQLRHVIIPLCENNWRGPARAEVNASSLLFCGAPLRHDPVSVLSHGHSRRGIGPHVWKADVVLFASIFKDARVNPKPSLHCSLAASSPFI